MKTSKQSRVAIAVGLGAALGVICIIGGSVRLGGFAGNEMRLLAIWYNRVVMGLVIGFAGQWQLMQGSANRYVRGALLGLLVSLETYLWTSFTDPVTFLAGAVYGVIIEWVLGKVESKQSRGSRQ